MPRLWDATIDAHRRAVRDAILDAAAGLAARHGVSAVRMAQVATESGIGRATLYKYFPDVGSILAAWHERQVAEHLEQLRQAAAGADRPVERLRAVLETYAAISRSRGGHHGDHGRHGGHGDEAFVQAMHQGGHVATAQRTLHEFLHGLIRDGLEAGAFAADLDPAEAATFCLHALGAASSLDTADAGRRLVSMVLRALGEPPAHRAEG